MKMSDSGPTKRGKHEQESAYRICVLGWLDESWSGRLGGMTITRGQSAGHLPMTTLIGQVKDQAALLGVLNVLYELHLPLLSVKLVNGE
jgi:hypothetical protein